MASLHNIIHIAQVSLLYPRVLLQKLCVSESFEAANILVCRIDSCRGWLGRDPREIHLSNSIIFNHFISISRISTDLKRIEHGHCSARRNTPSQTGGFSSAATAAPPVMQSQCINSSGPPCTVWMAGFLLFHPIKSVANVCILQCQSDDDFYHIPARIYSYHHHTTATRIQPILKGCNGWMTGRGLRVQKGSGCNQPALRRELLVDHKKFYGKFIIRLIQSPTINCDWKYQWYMLQKLQKKQKLTV